MRILTNNLGTSYKICHFWNVYSPSISLSAKLSQHPFRFDVFPSNYNSNILNKPNDFQLASFYTWANKSLWLSRAPLGNLKLLLALKDILKIISFLYLKIQCRDAKKIMVVTGNLDIWLNRKMGALRGNTWLTNQSDNKTFKINPAISAITERCPRGTQSWKRISLTFWKKKKARWTENWWLEPIRELKPQGRWCSWILGRTLVCRKK